MKTRDQFAEQRFDGFLSQKIFVTIGISVHGSTDRVKPRQGSKDGVLGCLFYYCNVANINKIKLILLSFDFQRVTAA